MSGTQHCVSTSPAGPLAPHLALPNRVLEGGVCIALPRTPFRALLRCNFAARSESIGCSCARVTRRANFVTKCKKPITTVEQKYVALRVTREASA